MDKLAQIIDKGYSIELYYSTHTKCFFAVACKTMEYYQKAEGQTIKEAVENLYKKMKG